MSRINKPGLLVGSIAAGSIEDVFNICARHGNDIFNAFPDGELGNRNNWVMFLFTTVYNAHPDIEILNKPSSANYEDNWKFRLRPDVRELHFQKLGYANEAEKSYKIFCRLRDEGIITKDIRFQVSLPAIESAFRWVFHVPDDFNILCEAYYQAIKREFAEIIDIIPPSDLSLQWDVCWETVDIEAAERGVKLGLSEYEPPGDPFERFVINLSRLGNLVPEQALMGLHLCYGDMGNRHCIEPVDLSITTRMANEIVKKINRPVDYVHMPVPITRMDDKYFKPLASLTVNSKIFLGLIHEKDGVEGAKKRVGAAKPYLSNMGIATECGMGRRAPEIIPELLDIHRQVALSL